jgi:hypothetical protein
MLPAPTTTGCSGQTQVQSCSPGAPGNDAGPSD